MVVLGVGICVFCFEFCVVLEYDLVIIRVGVEGRMVYGRLFLKYYKRVFY